MGVTSLSRLLSTGAIIGLLAYFADALGQDVANEVRHVRVLETDDYFDVVNLEGVVFPPRANTVLVLDQPILDAATVVLVPPGGLPIDANTASVEISDPINITFDSRTGHLFLFEPRSTDLVVIQLARSLVLGIQRFKAPEFGVEDPRGIAVDPETGNLFLLDGVGPKIVQIDPGPSQSYEGVMALSEGRISKLFLPPIEGIEYRGLGFNPADGGLYVFSPTRQELYQVRGDGDVVLVGGFSGSSWIDPKGVVFAPSLDRTDDPGQMNLYIASSGGPSGQVSEWSLVSSGGAGKQ